MIKISALLAILIFGSACSSLLYYPRQETFYKPAQFKLKYENIFFENKDGVKLHGWWFPAKTSPAKGTWVFYHGNAENLSTHFIALSWLPDAGYNYFIFDYPGYGDSDGSPSPYNNVISGEAALNWVHTNKDSSPLIIYGQSMGGVTALRNATDLKSSIPMRIVIADGTFSSFQRIARKKLGQHWLTWILQPLAYVTLSDRWAPDVDKISPLPLLVLHGEKDPVVDLEHGERIFNDALGPKAMIKIPEGTHNDLFWVAEKNYRETVMKKIDEMAPIKSMEVK